MQRQFVILAVLLMLFTGMRPLSAEEILPLPVSGSTLPTQPISTDPLQPPPEPVDPAILLQTTTQAQYIDRGSGPLTGLSPANRFVYDLTITTTLYASGSKRVDVKGILSQKFAGGPGDFYTTEEYSGQLEAHYYESDTGLVSEGGFRTLTGTGEINRGDNERGKANGSMYFKIDIDENGMPTRSQYQNGHYEGNLQYRGYNSSVSKQGLQNDSFNYDEFITETGDIEREGFSNEDFTGDPITLSGDTHFDNSYTKTKWHSALGPYTIPAFNSTLIEVTHKDKMGNTTQVDSNYTEIHNTPDPATGKIVSDLKTDKYIATYYPAQIVDGRRLEQRLKSESVNWSYKKSGPGDGIDLSYLSPLLRRAQWIDEKSYSRNSDFAQNGALIFLSVTLDDNGIASSLEMRWNPFTRKLIRAVVNGILLDLSRPSTAVVDVAKKILERTNNADPYLRLILNLLYIGPTYF